MAFSDVNLTPRQIVAELDRYVVGQGEAKRAIALAVRNRWRRGQLSDELRPEIAPKNILMAGPTGVGKTEIARRLAKLTQAPFIKVEATKYTEVGYYGRDVESMVRDLVENAISMVRANEQATVQSDAEEAAEERLLDLLIPPSPTEWPVDPSRNQVTRRMPLGSVARVKRCKPCCVLVTWRTKRSNSVSIKNNRR